MNIKGFIFISCLTTVFAYSIPDHTKKTTNTLLFTSTHTTPRRSMTTQERYYGDFLERKEQPITINPPKYAPCPVKFIRAATIPLRSMKTQERYYGEFLEREEQPITIKPPESAPCPVKFIRAAIIPRRSMTTTKRMVIGNQYLRYARTQIKKLDRTNKECSRTKTTLDRAPNNAAEPRVMRRGPTGGQVVRYFGTTYPTTTLNQALGLRPVDPELGLWPSQQIFEEPIQISTLPDTILMPTNEHNNPSQDTVEAPFMTTRNHDKQTTEDRPNL